MKPSTLGELIRSLRKQHNMTQAMLARKVGVTDKAVSKWERDLSYPDISLFPRLADILGVSLDDLLRECTEEESPSRLVQIFQLSHDIRTPLNIILGFTNMAAKHHDDPEQLLRYLDIIRDSGEYLLLVIDHLMDVAHLDNREIADRLRPVLGEKREGPAAFASLAPMVDFSGRRVLLVEDIELNREIALELLKQTGARVETAEDGLVCLEKVTRAETGYYDLILMDIQMPNMDGIEATRRIRQLEDREKASIPIIAMTANVYEQDQKAAFAAGMDDFAEKPIVTDQLFAAMKKALEKKR